MSELLYGLLALIRVLGLDGLGVLSGWLVALGTAAFFVWREKVSDANYQIFAASLEKQNQAWADAVKKNDDILAELITDSTKTMTMLAERVSSLQMLLIQNMGSR